MANQQLDICSYVGLLMISSGKYPNQKILNSLLVFHNTQKLNPEIYLFCTYLLTPSKWCKKISAFEKSFVEDEFHYNEYHYCFTQHPRKCSQEEIME